ncbi:MAG TPA: cytochrome c [Candidatus Rubrimentiphilum sp.]|nr:cytochrome c [Candidatus Rubrimentiphilum sp.]
MLRRSCEGEKKQPACPSRRGKSLTRSLFCCLAEYAVRPVWQPVLDPNSPVQRQTCHGAQGTGVPRTFPALADDPVVNGKNADTHIKIVLHGLSGKVIAGVRYAAQMPAFGSQLTDAQIAAVIDHERTSWGNNGPTVTPDEVRANH